jgi:hypothetical protein
LRRTRDEIRKAIHDRAVRGGSTIQTREPVLLEGIIEIVYAIEGVSFGVSLAGFEATVHSLLTRDTAKEKP